MFKILALAFLFHMGQPIKGSFDTDLIYSTRAECEAQRSSTLTAITVQELLEDLVVGPDMKLFSVDTECVPAEQPA